LTFKLKFNPLQSVTGQARREIADRGYQPFATFTLKHDIAVFSVAVAYSFDFAVDSYHDA
jgi:hypothetical protein